MSKVDEAIAEIDKQLAEIAPIHEGLRDYARLNLQQETFDVVNQAILQYDRRVQVLEAAKASLTTLVEDGYPELDIPDVSISALNDLQAQQQTIEAALAEFHSNAATSLGLQPESPTKPK